MNIKIIKEVSSITLAGLIAFIQILPTQMVPDKPWCNLWIIKFINSHTICATIFCCILIGIIISISLIWEKQCHNKQWLTKVLQDITDNYLCGRNFATRITIFKVTRRHLKPYVRFCYPLNLKNNPQRIPFSKKGESYEGIVGKCLKEAIEIECHTKSIDDINLAKKYKKNIEAHKKRIDTYMRETHINKYNILLKMHRKPTNFYAYPIVDNQANVWGILIVDNNEKEKFDFSNIKSVINTYVNLITLTLKL